MYLWNYKTLERDLQNGPLTSKESFKYFLVFVVLNAAAFEAAQYYAETFSYLLLANSILSFLFVLLGTIWSYTANKSGDGANFIERFISLGIPIGVRVVVLWGVLYLSYLILGNIFIKGFASFNEHTTYVDIIFTVLIYLYFYSRVVASLRSIATGRAT